jgi:hypothetical protein
MSETIMLKDAERFQTVDAIQAELQGALPWLWLPAFRIGENEGYDGRQFGTRAGPMDAKNSYNVLHEVGHAVEMTLLSSRIWKRRVQRPEFEMRIITHLEIGGRRYAEPVTMQATERECRVGGIQLRMLEAGGYDTKEFLQEFALTLRFVADWAHGGSCPTQPRAVERFDTEERRWLDTRISLVQQAYEQFSLPDVQDRWATVMSWLAKKRPQQTA